MALAGLFWLPEIIYHIMEKSDNTTSVSLMLTRRHLFDSLLPLVWKDVRGARRLFALVSSDFESTQETDWAVSKRLDVKMVRFKFCARFVKSVDFHSSGSFGDKTEGWKPSVFLSRTQPLLPNVVSITVTTDLRATHNRLHCLCFYHHLCGYLSSTMIS
ncbi:hypothetical protein BDV93DRAFT_40208 [Ceratobasidium sp. AG-I]|nr:hypothetical protein BDV93DRAFT_40208 [Ceratobasidium sp. AG-I]